jgi:c-di-GMP-binding flagellar brake protein YcgR
MALTPIKSSDFLVGRPLEWDAYDADGTLLFAKGTIVDEEIKARLLKRGALREIAPETARSASLAAKTVFAEERQTRQRVWLQLHETSVRPGDIVHLERGLDGTRLTTQFIGYQKNKSVVVTIPVDAQGPVFLKEGETVVVKVFSGKHVLAFPSTVLAFVAKPFPHLHLNYPADVSGVVVRHAKRAPTRIVASLESEGEQAAAIITDLSVGGLSFATRSATIQVGANIRCNFKIVIADCPFLLQAVCQVRSNRGAQFDVLPGATAYGAQFKELSAEDALVIALFVCQQAMLDAKNPAA